MIGLYFRTARYYRPSQIAARLRFSVQSALGKQVPGLARRRYRVPAGVVRDRRAQFFSPLTEALPWDLRRERENATRLKRGIFCFLNKEVHLGIPVIWNPAETRLWRYNLHYFEYAVDLALTSAVDHDPDSAKLLAQLWAEWIAAHPVGGGVAWHSYPIARRIVNWIQAFSLATRETVFGSTEPDPAWLASLHQQARYLETHLEFDCLGNHLLANGKALVFAGIFFGGETGARWLKTGRQILWRGLKDQILEDGGHEERSPMYHSIVLQDYLEVALVHRLNNLEVPDWVRTRMILMADFLAGVRHRDGEIPLFGDSAFGIAHAPADILAASERLLMVPGRWEGSTPGTYCNLLAPEVVSAEQNRGERLTSSDNWSATGYVKLTGSVAGDEMIIDAKPMGPLHLPAHGHCSLFSYELSVGGKRVIVDSGVDEYEPGPWREYWRSTRAHNTVAVDGAEQTEIWGSFRAGQRAQVLASQRVEANGYRIFAAVHGGFAGQHKATPHRRIIAALPGGLWMVLDEVYGSGTHTIESFVHLAPHVECTERDGCALAQAGHARLMIYPLSDDGSMARMTSLKGTTNPIQGWYAPEFGKKQQNTTLRLSSDSLLPGRLGYLIAPALNRITSWTVKISTLPASLNITINIQSDYGPVCHTIGIPGKPLPFQT